MLLHPASSLAARQRHQMSAFRGPTSPRARWLAAAAVVVALAAPAGSIAQLVREERAAIEQAVVAATPLVRGSTVRAAVEVRVAPGYHVNANPPTHDWLIPVEVSISGPQGIGVDSAYYPEPEHRKFPYADEAFAVYEGTVVVGLDIEIGDEAPLGAQELEIVLDYQACNDEACFAPTEATLKLPVTIAAAGTPTRPTPSPLLDKAPFPAVR